MGSKLILIGLCFLVQTLLSEISIDEQPELNAELQKYTYTGRDENGRPTWDYGYE